MKRLLYTLYVLLAVVVFFPSEKCYFTFEALLADYHIGINNEVLKQRYIYLDAENGEIVLDNQAVASVENIRLTPWILFNRLRISNLSITPAFRQFFPGKVDSLTITYSLLNPLEVVIQGEGDFGHFAGGYDLLSKKMRVVFEMTNQLRAYGLLVNQLHSEKEGLVYERNF